VSGACPVSSVKPSALVLGATGMLGHAVIAELATADFDVHATIRDRGRAGTLESIAVAQLHEFDATRDSVAELVEAIEPRTVINCIGLVKQLEAASEPLPAIRVNALFPHECAAACESLGTRFIHISTDCVFSGELPLGEAYTEEHQPDPHDMYGLTKQLGEVVAPRALTLRTSIIGWELERSSGLLEWFAAQDGGAVNGFTRAIFSGLTTRALARVLAWLITEHPELSGLYHVSSEPIDKYTLLRALRDVLAIDVEIVPVDEPVVNRALNSERLRDLTGLTVPSWDEMLAEYTTGRTYSHNAG
jgi:dTDP-4-dehydrorhamnose reductase